MYCLLYEQLVYNKLCIIVQQIKIYAQMHNCNIVNALFIIIIMHCD